MSGEYLDSKKESPDNEATVIRSTISGSGAESSDIRLEYIEKIRNHQLNFAKYQVRDKIAEGGMGSIHKVFDKNLHRPSVLKIILPKIQEDPALFRQFIKEAQITARLEHPNIIPVHDIGVIDGDRLHFAMKEVHGDSLSKILRDIRDGSIEQSQRFSYYALLTIFRKVCDAVAFAHSKGILHRDIKPENIMVGGFGEVLLMDWGLAKILGSEEITPPEELDAAFGSNLSSESTLSGVVKGSPAFMSPEQAKGLVEKIDERSDVFLLGSTLYNIATLVAPYTGVDIEETLQNAQQGNLTGPDARSPERKIPRDLIRIIQKAMAFDPADRYENVDLLIKDIDALLEGSTTATTKVFETGEIIIREGDVGEEAYLISSGKVEVYKSIENGEVQLQTLDEGDVIGEMALISNSVRSASIRAVERTELVMITREVMEQGLSQLPFWLRTAVNCLTERLLHANTHVHPLIHNDCLYHVLRQLQFSYLSMGTIETETPEGKKSLIANIEAVVGDIASNLCMPVERVESIMSGLLEQNIVRGVGVNGFRVSNMSVLDKLVRQAATEQSIATEIDRPGFKSLDELQVSSIDQVLGCDCDAEIEPKLKQILQNLRRVI